MGSSVTKKSKKDAQEIADPPQDQPAGIPESDYSQSDFLLGNWQVQ